MEETERVIATIAFSMIEYTRLIPNNRKNVNIRTDGL